MPPCKYYALGKCLRGDSCYYSHGIPHATALPETERRFVPDQSIPLPVTACNNPRKSHPLHPPTSSSTDTRSTIPCHFFSKGRCTKGTSCPFAHSIGEEIPQLAGLNINRETIPAQPRHDGAKACKRELGGALVEFGDGARVQKVSLPADFSAVRINGLPLRSTVLDVVNILADFGFEVGQTSIRVTRIPGVSHSSADVKVEDPMFATKLCERLAREKIAHGHDALLEATKVPVKLTFESSAQSVDCRTVMCSWHKSTRVAWMNFGSEDIAKTVAYKFNNDVYKIFLKKVICDTPTRSGGYHNRQAWTVAMRDLPGYTDEEDIKHAIRDTRDKPRHIELGRPSYHLTQYDAGDAVRRMCEAIGPVESFEVKEAPDSKRLKATTRFSQDSDAIEAVRTLNSATLPFSNGKLSVQAVYSTKLKVANNIYDVVKEEICHESAQWRQQHINFSAYPPSDSTQPYTAMKMSGQDAKQVAQAKNSLLEILNGFIVMKGDVPVWSKSFNDPVTLRRFKQLEEDFGVIVIRDRRRSRVRLYGPSTSRALAEKAIADMGASPVTTTHTIELNPDQFRKVVKSGYRKAITLLGEDAIIVDVLSTPKRIIITGSLQDHQAVQRILSSLNPEDECESEEQSICAICWTEAESPLMTQCRHTYCLDCFENLCCAPAHGTEEYLIQCAGSSGKCETVFSLNELQDSLSSTVFEDVLQSSFTSYIRRRPQAFRYCPQPNCGNIYRVTDPLLSVRTHICSQCLAAICKTCHAIHDDMTCAEFKYLQSGGHEATEKLKRQLGCKDCPKCETTMEKTEGCNHMICSGCGIHICWVCLATFGASGPCYDHMNKVHGGIGLNDLALLEDDMF